MPLVRYVQQYGFANLHTVSRNGNVHRRAHEGEANVLPRGKMLWRPAAMMFAAGCTFIISGPGIGCANTELSKEPDLPLALAQKPAKAALAKCEEERYKVSVAVVNRGGNVKVLLRGDGAGLHTQDSSARKAYTASSI